MLEHKCSTLKLMVISYIIHQSHLFKEHIIVDEYIILVLNNITGHFNVL